MDRRSLLFLLSVTAAFFLVRIWYTPKDQTPRTAWKKTEQEIKSTVMEAPAEPVTAGIAPAQPTYYVLENGYQQLVFSSVGGSIVEINLPFKSAQAPKSVVRPVEADTTMLDQAPKESLFPAVDATRSDGSILKPVRGQYYPLLRRIYTKLPISAAAPLESLALTSPYAEFSALPFRVTSFTPNSITFEARQPNRLIKKRFSFPNDPSKFPYCIDVEITIDGDRKDIWLTSGIPEIELMSGASGAALKYRVVRGNRGDVEKVDLPKTTFTSSSIQPDWVCDTNGFFGIILDPLRGAGTGMSFVMVPGTDAPSRLLSLSGTGQNASPESFPGYEVKLPFSPTDPSMQLRMFAGPLADSVLTTIDNNSMGEYGKPTNYVASQTFHGWFAFISEPFAKFIFFLMKQFHALFGSWVLSIILVTIVLRILLYPLNRWSIRSMRAMQEVAPMIKAIQEKYKKDPKRAQMEVMALYREKRVNPFSGCLPLLIQMPFLIGMFDLLRSSFELRGTPFIPGWIDDLSAPDVLFDWHYSLPLIGHQLHILPFILGATMWWQQHMSSTMPKNPREWTDQQRQQRAMGNIMTVVMTVLFYQFPAGLNIYWISSMLLGIVQQWWTKK
jgi:YidC/Oxa1 family membrane protein insertase